MPTELHGKRLLFFLFRDLGGDAAAQTATAKRTDSLIKVRKGLRAADKSLRQRFKVVVQAVQEGWDVAN